MLVSGISGNRYHKTDFKAHVSMESKCADHHCKFALSKHHRLWRSMFVQTTLAVITVHS